MEHKAVCKAVHGQAILGLVATALSGRPPNWLAKTLAETHPKELARTAQLNQVHTMIAPILGRHAALAEGLPQDLRIFFEAMYAANRDRLDRGLSQLREIGAALDAIGVPAIILKGGGDMLDPLHADQAIRFVGDLDILVSEARAAEAHDSLTDIGAKTFSPVLESDPNYTWRGHRTPEHHFPKLIRDGWDLPVELHVRVGKRLEDKILPAIVAIERRAPSKIPGLFCCSPEDRACHLIAHASRHRGLVSLRAWIDWAALRKICDVSQVRDRFEALGQGSVFEEFDQVTDFLECGLGQGDETNGEYALARTALRDFGTTPSRGLAGAISFVQRKSRGLAISPEYRSYVVRNAMSRQWWSDMWRRWIRTRRRPW